MTSSTRRPASEIEPETSGASMTIRGASTADAASLADRSPVAAAPTLPATASGSTCGASPEAAATAASCSAMACCISASFSSSGPTTNICQPNRTAIDSVMARIILRFSGFIRRVPARAGAPVVTNAFAYGCRPVSGRLSSSSPGTGSNAGSAQGWQREIRFSVNHPPRKGP